MSGDPRDLVILFSRGVAQRRMYAAEHPKVVACVDEFDAALRSFLTATGQESVFIGVNEGRLVYGGRFLMGASIVGGKLIELAGRLRCGGFTFTAETRNGELCSFLDLAAELKEAVTDLDEARRLLAAHGVETVELAAEYVAADQFDPANRQVWEGEEHAHDFTVMGVSQALFDATGDVHRRAQQGQPLELDDTFAAAERLATLPDEDCRDLLQLVRYPDYDTYTVGHSVRLAVLGVLTARTLGVEQHVLTEMGAAGLLHDVGKSRIPEEILFKPGKLDDDERRVMETHAALGAEILLEDKHATPLIIGAAWGHHLTHGGGGYPRLPFRPVRSWFTSLLQVCDIFEALTAVRPYKTSLSPRRAYEIMADMVDLFNPQVLRSFVRAVGLYPPGCKVQLSDGSRGVVLAAGEDFTRPRLHRSVGPDGEPGGQLLDLGEERHAGLEVVGICD